MVEDLKENNSTETKGAQSLKEEKSIVLNRLRGQVY